MEFSLDFFRDEVRNGFYIPGAIKQAWAASMMVLDEIDKICKKYDITYFADSGTLLGAVRHGGFVPWDDDIDICMKREDYDRFKEVAEKELPENFCLHDYMRKDDYWLFITKVVNHKHICFEEDHLRKYHNFPYLASVDIFVLDYLYDDEEKEHARCEEVKYLIALADLIVEKKVDRSVLENELDKVASLYNVSINRELDSVGLGRALYFLAEQQMMRVKAVESHRLGQMFPWVLKNELGFDKRLCGNEVYLPFEFINVPCPVEYNYMLNWHYGRFLLLNKNKAMHGYPYFESQKKNLIDMADFEIPEYRFCSEMLVCKRNEQMGIFQMIVNDTIEDIHQYIAEYETSSTDLDFEIAINILPKCQSLVIELGNYIENMLFRYISGYEECIKKLEMFCEALFHMFEYLNNESNKSYETILDEKYVSLERDMKNSLNVMEDAIETLVLQKRLVAFLPDNLESWEEMKMLYEKYLDEENKYVLVIPLPVFAKNPYGEIRFDEMFIDEYPNDLKITAWDKIDISLYGFDEIIIQNQYDNENGYLSVPPAYYSEKLRNYTKCLTYLMKGGVDDFGVEDMTSMYGLKYRLGVPAAMYADRIIISSENMKLLYEDYLTEFAGEHTRNIWKEKLVYLKKDEIIENEDISKSVLLYCIGEDQFVFDENKGLHRIEERLAIIDRIKNIDIYIYFYPRSFSEWNWMSSDIKDKLKSLIQAYNVYIYNESGVGMMVLDKISEYYGSPSPIATSLIKKNKFVLISRDSYHIDTLYYKKDAYILSDGQEINVGPKYFNELTKIT